MAAPSGMPELQDPNPGGLPSQFYFKVPSVGTFRGRFELKRTAL
ncbi:hypothetical protein [Oculatella sp. LEGE 06141]|nr:hypothetical protein [Oculatella sp. LEGE 06141]